jgi:predicted acylesterase/phospholipase RssA
MAESPEPTLPIAAPAPPPEFDRLASVTIQGGAVYGLSLLGQLQGVLDKGYEIVALAGTSAGAIVATLYWAGLKTTDIRRFFEERARTPEGVTDLLGRAEPSANDLSIRHLNRVFAAGARLATGVRQLFSGPWWSWPVKFCCLPLVAPLYVGSFFKMIRDVRAGLHSSRGGGLFPGEVFEQEIDRLIRASPRVAPHVASGRLPSNRLLTFGHLRGLLENVLAYFPALTLTATDLSTGQLLLIDSTDERFADVPIAKAVRASGGFPLFFAPVEVELPDPNSSEIRRVHSLVDGGVICNFPAYVFSRRLRREQFGNAPIYQPYVMRPWVNIGLRLTEPQAAHCGPVRSRLGVFGRLWNLLSAGTRTHLETALAESTVERLFSLGQPFAETGWPYDMLDFDRLTPQLVRQMYDRGREFASKELSTHRFTRPPIEAVQPYLDALLTAACQVFGRDDNSVLRFRVTFFVPDDLELVLEYRANMDDPADTDRSLRLEYWQGLVGFSFIRRRPVLCNLQLLNESIHAGVADPQQLFGLTPEIRSRIRSGRTWLMSVPVFDPETADAYPYGDNPEVGVEGLHYAELDSPLDGALFGVLSLDAGFEYSNMTLPLEVDDQVNHPRVSILRDIMVATAWSLGKEFAAYFAATEPEPGDLTGG